MIITRIKQTDDKLFEFFKEVYLDSFPPEERRSIGSIESLVRTSDEFSLYVFLLDGEPVAFFSTWDLGEFAYGEHFAVHKQRRSTGIGSTIVKTLLSQINLPFVIEVEPPVEDMAIRRISFYEKLGFVMSGYDYIQPPYSEDLPSVSLKLMGYGCDLLRSNPSLVEQLIHSRIYNVRM